MELRVPSDLEAKLNRLASLSGKTPEKVALELLSESLEYNIWFAQEVAKGQADARAGRLIDHDEVVTRFNARHPR